MMTPAHHQLKLHPTQVTARPHAIRDVERVHVVLLQLLHLDWIVGLERRREGGREGGRVEIYVCAYRGGKEEEKRRRGRMVYYLKQLAILLLVINK